MKLIIQIPCYDEEKTLPITVDELPKKINGIEKIEYLVIDDGSKDNTVEVARECGVHHIIKHSKNYGLAMAFMSGIKECLKLGADIIVNTDADNQYCAKDIKKIIRPILDGKAEIVVGARPIDNIKSFSTIKKILQKIGSWVVRIVSETDIQDAPSGFRAFSKEAAYRMNVFTKYTYTLETIIQAGQRGMTIISVPVRVNTTTRPSRLIKSIISYINQSSLTIIRIFVTYKPLSFFGSIGSIFFLAGVALGFRYIYFLIINNAGGHIQSLILAAILMILGFLFVVLGLLGELIATNRRLLEDIQYDVRKIKNEKQ